VKREAEADDKSLGSCLRGPRTGEGWTVAASDDEGEGGKQSERG
jgi:hypothetical protein